MDTHDFDAYTPMEMAARVERTGITKGNLDFLTTFTLAVLAGAFIGFGAAFFTYVIHDSQLTSGWTKLLGGLVFCLGLILVIVAGAELFTGNSLLVMAYVSRRITLEQLLRNWGIVYIGNLVGALSIVALVLLSGHWESTGAVVGAKALLIANTKVNLTFWQALSRGVLCNILVCLAVWLCFSGRSVTDKILAIIFPITAFVALGFEHSVANMYFIPVGLILKANPQVLDTAQSVLSLTPDLSNLTISGFVIDNLLPVTLGNVIGGSIFVGGVYWFLYLRKAAVQPIRRMMTVGPPTVAMGTSVAQAIEEMAQHKTSSVLVGEPSRATGIVSEADIVRKVTALELDPDDVQVNEIMSSPLIAVDIKTPIYEIYRTMADQHIRHLLITEDGEQIGFVSVKDILAKPIF